MLCIVPARGGSKGVPRKNLRELGGVPLVAHAIRCALATPEITRVVLSTDDEEIAQAGRRAGAEVPFLRSAELATDSAPARLVYLDLCARLEAAGAPRIDAFVVLQPTSPLRAPADVSAAIGRFAEAGSDVVMTVHESPHPVTWTMRVDEAGILRPWGDWNALAQNRQQEVEALVPNGVAFVFRRAFLADCQSYLGERTHAVRVPRPRAIDIDDEVDFALAELLWQRREARGEP